MDQFSLAKKEHFDFEDLKEIVAILRSPEGCPWDREQTHGSLKNNLVEEAWEVAEGIEKDDPDLLREELGDVLLQVIFHAQMEKEAGRFDMDGVIDGIAKKMIRRHPHVFSPEHRGEDPDDWEEIKRKEKGETTLADSLYRVCTALPALKMAEKFIQKGAKITEDEFHEDSMLQMGAKFFRLCQSSTAKGIDPEEALRAYLNNLLQNCTKY